METGEDKRDWAEVEAFYDNFIQKLTKDFLFGNKRIKAAIKFAIRQFGHHPKQILDIGCGLGWTSFEMARHFPEAKVLGVDLSGQLILTAQKLFKHNNLTYKQVDVTSPGFSFERKFEAVLLVDVYEHIPAEDRSSFHQALKRLLAPNARVVITCPTIFHQHWLRDHQPDGLQPVDEDLTLKDMEKMAHDLNGQLSVFHSKSIWHGYDYFHAMIDLQAQWGATIVPMHIAPLSRLNRLWRVFSSLSAQHNPLYKPGNWPYYIKTWFTGM